MTIPNLSQIKFVKSVSDQLKQFKEIDHFGEELGKPLSCLLGLGRSSGADFVEFFSAVRSGFGAVSFYLKCLETF